MLENCVELHDCETLLTEAVKHVQLLGEIHLADPDIGKLAEMVRDTIVPNISKGTRLLKTKYPVTFACFLVGMGRLYDKDIGFWPIVEKKVGAIDINWKTKWGKFFLQFLEQHDLPQFNEEEGLAYVTPILGHVCIPDRCLDEYFDRVMVPLVNRELLNPLDGEEIIHDLRTRRTINNCRLALERKKKEQVENRDELLSAQRSLVRRRDIYQAASALIADEAECERKRIALQGLEDAESTRINYIDQIKAAAEVVCGLETDGKRIWTEIKALQKRYQPILDHKDQIVEIIQTHQKLAVTILEAKVEEETLFAQVTAHWAALSSQPWEDHYGAAIIELVIDQIHAQIEQVQVLEEQLKKIQERMEILRASQKPVRKPPPFLVPFILVWRLFFGAGEKTKKSPSSELQNLRAALEQTKVDLRQKRTAIQLALSQLPIDSRQLETPKIGLHLQIVAIHQICVQALETRKTRCRLEQEAEDLIQSARELIPSLGMTDQGSNGSWTERLANALAEAVQSQERVRKFRQVLEEEVRPALEAARTEVQHLQKELTSLDDRLTKIGDGSIDQSLSRVREFHQFQKATAKTRQNLNNRYVDFASLECELRGEGLDTIQARLEEAAAKIDDQVNKTEKELERVEQDFGRYPAQYFGIDEPIRRFLLYGETTSERILRSSVFIFARTKTGERREHISEPELPDRLIQRFRQWWEYYQARTRSSSNSNEETNPTTGERYRAPQIAFDLAAGEVIAVLPAQHILRPERGTMVELEIYGDNQNEPIDSAWLKLYNRSKGLVDTQPCEAIVLTAPSEKYIFRLTNKDQLIHEWEIPGVSAEAPYLAFSVDTNKRINEDALPKAHIILITKKNHAIHPDNCILTTSDHLYGGWSEYVWYELDLSTNEEIYLITEEGGKSISLLLTINPGTGVTLVGGQQSPNVVSDEQAVFTAMPECVRIPITDQSDLHLLRFSIISEDENRFLFSKHFQLNDLAGIFESNNEGWFDLPLSYKQFLGENPFGRFTLRVYKPPYLDWQTTFCVVAGLELSFDQEAYLPYRESIPIIRALLTMPGRSIFQPDHPTIVLSKDETTWQIQVPATENQITGIITNSNIEKGSTTLLINLVIPKIHWRLQGLYGTDYDQWLDHIEEELWLGDWADAQELFLLVDIPDTLTGEVELVLPGNSMTVPGGRITGHTVRFDLKALEDVLRAGPTLETIAISLCGDTISIPRIPLFTVCTRWLAERIKCFYYPEGDAARLDVSWGERGKAKQKAARLWYLSGDQPKLIQEQIVSIGKQETTFRSPKKEVKSGRYLVHLEPYDPWSSRATCPNPNDVNTTIIEIATRSSEKSVTLRTVTVDPKHSYPLREGSYKIHIIGKVTNQHLPDNAELENIGHVLVTLSNENWYVGNLEVVGIPRVIDHLSDTNPVKFEYDSERQIITSIEDRHGDGAVYCFECRMLFWYQGTVEKEKRRKHHNYGPIEEFRVDWEAE